MSFCQVCGNKTSKTKYQRCQEHRVSSRFGGRTHTPESRAKIASSMKGVRVGSENPLWRGGLPKCVDCGAQLGSYKSTRCMRHAALEREKNSIKPIYGRSCLFCSTPLSRSARIGLCRRCVSKSDGWRRAVSLNARARVASGKHHWGTGKLTPLNSKVRESSEMKRWTDAVYARDDYICQACGERGGKLTADHIKPFSEIMRRNKITTFEGALACVELWDLGNGRTLCRPCHKKTETWGVGAVRHLKKLQLI